MPVLIDKQIQYGFNYFHKDEPRQKWVIEVAEYNGESALTINCTQLGDSFTPQYKTAGQKKRVLQEWCDFLIKNDTAFEELRFGSRMPQQLFDAACSQKRFKKLSIKWGVYPDLTRLAQLTKLEYLHLGSGSGTISILPIAKLTNLVALSVENFQKITDYSPFTALTHLESLSIEGDGMGPQYIHVDSLEFLKQMPQLRFFSLLTARLKSKDLSPLLALTQLEHLTLRASKEAKALYPQLAALPKLKYGLLVKRPEMYKS
ncbi:MAG: hypothetical protein ACK5JF_06905 [Oscillospiraceae bacterium]